MGREHLRLDVEEEEEEEVISVDDESHELCAEISANDLRTELQRLDMIQESLKQVQLWLEGIEKVLLPQ